jgi:hypothetical protein
VSSASIDSGLTPAPRTFQHSSGVNIHIQYDRVRYPAACLTDGHRGGVQEHRGDGEFGHPVRTKDNRLARSKCGVQPKGGAPALRPAAKPFAHDRLILQQRFAAVIMRIREPKTTALIFSSGKVRPLFSAHLVSNVCAPQMVCTGAKTEHDSRLAARKYARIVQVRPRRPRLHGVQINPGCHHISPQKLGFPARFTEFKIQNIVASCDAMFPIRL